MRCTHCGQGPSTKSKSYGMLNIPKADGDVLDYLTDYPVSSRAQIAKGATMKLQTVCGAVRRLIDNGLAEVVGKTYDAETNREVEVLAPTALAK